MLSATAVSVHLAGWKAYDAGEQGLAQRYYHQSYGLAVESGIVGRVDASTEALFAVTHAHGLAATTAPWPCSCPAKPRSDGLVVYNTRPGCCSEATWRSYSAHTFVDTRQPCSPQSGLHLGHTVPRPSLTLSGILVAAVSADGSPGT
ncbi:hypothetical protein [Kitasatospora sp. NPDC089509]|uniref:hypothetical protein n=1 Tax=Kitasatospora sp. NPDC089509 TaxID=3364079 RepID=UPI0038155508